MSRASPTASCRRVPRVWRSWWGWKGEISSSRATWRQMCRAPLAVRRLSREPREAGWKLTKRAGEGSARAARVVLHCLVRPRGDDDDSLAVALAADRDPVAAPVGPVEGEGLGDPAAGGEEEADERPVPFLGDGPGGKGPEQAVTVVGLERLGEALGEPGQVDGRPQVAGEPLLSGREAQEAAQGDQPPGAGGHRQGPGGAAVADLEAGEVALVGAEEVAVDVGDVGDALVAAGEGGEAVEVPAVLADRPGAAVAVELLPGEELLDRLGEGDAGKGGGHGDEDTS